MQQQNITSPAPDWLTPVEAAAFLKINVKLVYQMAAAGEIPHSRIRENSRKGIRFSLESLNRWMKDKEQ